MKKLREIIKPNVAIILGALMLLLFLNYLAFRGTALALGIIGLVVAAYYLGVGIISLLISDKLPKTLKIVLDLVTVGLFPAFMFTQLLMMVIQSPDALGPTGWTIAVIGMAASLGLIAMYIVFKLLKNKLFERLALLLSATFVLFLILNLVFDFSGVPEIIGNLPISIVAMYLSYSVLLYNAFLNKEENPPVEEPAKEEEPKEAEEKEEEPKENEE